MKICIEEYLISHLRRNRFFEAVFNSGGDKVFPVPPGDQPSDLASLLETIVDHKIPEEVIWDLDDSLADVGFPTGAINEITVIEVSRPTGQEFMDELELQTAQIWTPRARYYLFDHIEPSKLHMARCVSAELRVVNDGEWIPYPGSDMNGHLVHWEQDRWAVGTCPLPSEFWDPRGHVPE